MSESKHLKWVDYYSTDAEPKTDNANDAVSPRQSAANDADGWDQYRQWVTKAPAPRRRRAGIDPSLYTWRGYRNWSEQVKRNWDPEDRD